MCLKDGQGYLALGLIWKLGELELTWLICQHLLKFTFVVRSTTEQYDFVTGEFIILVSFYRDQT